MIYQPDLSELVDWESLSDDGIDLSPEQIDRAVQISQAIPAISGQWQTYLNALGLFGFKQWLEECAPDLEIVDSDCSLFQPQTASLIEAACNLRVGAFTLCLLTVGSLIDTMIDLPRATVDLPPFIPHIYVLMEVIEEQMQAHVYGYLRRDQLLAWQQAIPLSAPQNWIYSLPLNRFNLNPISLLLDLRCLNPEIIPLTPLALPGFVPVAQLQTRLSALMPQLRSPHASPHQLLTWEESATLLTHPELADWLYPAPPSVPQNWINVALWLRDRIDTTAQELAWMLMPPMTPANALRSIGEELSAWGVQVPPEARGAHQDLQLGGAALQIYAIVWLLPLPDATEGWTLLIVLRAQPSHHLPPGIRLQIRDEAQLLSEQVLQTELPDAYLYSQVGGAWSEQFWVTIELMDGATVTLPPFGYEARDEP